MKYLLLALLLLAACNPYLTQQSVAPPGRSARLDEVGNFWGLKHYRLELSEGVALALTCERGSPCEKMIVVSENPAIAEVRPASLAALQRSASLAAMQSSAADYVRTQQPMSAFVLVGKAPGKTTVHVRAVEGERDVVVTVVAPPPPPNGQTAATAQK